MTCFPGYVQSKRQAESVILETDELKILTKNSNTNNLFTYSHSGFQCVSESTRQGLCD